MRAYRSIHSIVFAITSSFLLPGSLNSMPTALGEARLFLVPRGADPGEYSEGPSVVYLRPGQRITLELYVENVAPTLLRGVSAKLDDATDGTTGTVTYDPFSVTVNWIHGDYVFQSICEMCFGSGPPAWLFPHVQAGGVLVTEARYGGELDYVASFDACGEFTIDFIVPTVLTDPTTNLIPHVTEQTFIRILSGDLNSDGIVDILDIFKVIDGSRGIFEFGQDVSDVDIRGEDPCLPDGVLDLLDIFAVLDVFQGIDRCGARCVGPD